MSTQLNSSQLELKITEKTLGTLVTNAREIKLLVESGMAQYSIDNYSENNIEQAKVDKATLNKAAKDLNDRRIEIEREFMRPFGEFKDIVSETVSLIKTASTTIDLLVKDVELKTKNDKKIQIEKLFLQKSFTLVSLSKIFDEKWLNKTATIKSIDTAIDERIASIKSDIGTIEAMQDLGMEHAECDLAKSIYLDTLNLSSAMEYLRKLKANRDRAKADAETRAEQQAQVILLQQKPTEIAEQEFWIEPVYQPSMVSEQPQILTRAFKVTATTDQIIALGNYMNVNGISFQTLDI